MKSYTIQQHTCCPRDKKESHYTNTAILLLSTEPEVS